MSDLRKNLIRLAHQHPEMREQLLPLLKTAKWDVARAAERLDLKMNSLRDRKFRELLDTVHKTLIFFDIDMDRQKSWIGVAGEDGFMMSLTLMPEKDSGYNKERLQDLFIQEFNMGVGVQQLGPKWVVTVG